MFRCEVSPYIFPRYAVLWQLAREGEIRQAPEEKARSKNR